MKSNDQLEPTVFVIFGGAGDLTWRKLVPALFDLSQDRSLLAQFVIIAVDRIKLGEDVLRRAIFPITPPAHGGRKTHNGCSLPVIFGRCRPNWCSLQKEGKEFVTRHDLK